VHRNRRAEMGMAALALDTDGGSTSRDNNSHMLPLAKAIIVETVGLLSRNRQAPMPLVLLWLDLVEVVVDVLAVDGTF